MALDVIGYQQGDRYNIRELFDSEKEPDAANLVEDSMKKLTAEQIKRQGELTKSLESISVEITEAVQAVNATIAASRESVGSLRIRYNERIREVAAFMQSIHDQQENYFDERSTSWQEGDAGQSYESWMEEWNTDLEELDEVELPDEVDEPEFDAVTALRELPEHP